MSAHTDEPLRSGTLPRHLRHAPYAVILAEYDEIRFGDVLLDTSDGPLVVSEIIRRRHLPIAEYAEDRPARSDREASEVRRIIHNEHHRLRVARSIEKFAPLAGHSMRVRSHNPVQRGMYVLNDGWLPECSCGWPSEQRVCGGRQSARREWLEHKAEVISGRSVGEHLGLSLVTAAEQQHELPPFPWSFAFNGVAIAQLDKLGLERGTAAAQAWADAFGSAVERDDMVDAVSLHVTVLPAPRARAAVAIDGFFEIRGEAAK